MVGVATDTYGEVPVTLEVLGAETETSLDDWDHIAEASLLVSAGRITLMGAPTSRPASSWRCHPARSLTISIAALPVMCSMASSMTHTLFHSPSISEPAASR